MKVLLCHNRYLQEGGEDQGFEDDVWMLESHGHEVIRFEMSNESISDMNKFSLAAKTIWNSTSHNRISTLIRRERPALVHCSNIFPLVSPSVYSAARKFQIPVIQKLQNFRLTCLNSYLLRDGRICEDCLGKTLPWRGVIHRCYRNSLTASSVVASMLVVHRTLKTWSNAVTLYTTPSNFARTKLVEAGLPQSKIFVRPNFVRHDPGSGNGNGDYAIFAGRLSEEKGIKTMLDAWDRTPASLKLKILGDGPLSQQVMRATESNNRIEWLGWQPVGKLQELIADAKCLIMPSIWYETFGRTIIQSFASGTPVVASGIGAMAEIVQDGVSGLHFDANNPDSLVEKVVQLHSDFELRAKMRLGARRVFESSYTPQINYPGLINLYQRAIAAA